MSQTVHRFAVGTTEKPLEYMFVDADGTAVSLTGATPSFQMVDEHGEDIISETTTGVEITNASTGAVRFTFSAAQVAAAKIGYAYFIADWGSSRDISPAIEKQLKVIIHEL